MNFFINNFGRLLLINQWENKTQTLKCSAKFLAGISHWKIGPGVWELLPDPKTILSDMSGGVSDFVKTDLKYQNTFLTFLL